jgi:hypothetical protein
MNQKNHKMKEKKSVDENSAEKKSKNERLWIKKFQKEFFFDKISLFFFFFFPFFFFFEKTIKNETEKRGKYAFGGAFSENFGRKKRKYSSGTVFSVSNGRKIHFSDPKVRFFGLFLL